jgi:hypothetical protein
MVGHADRAQRVSAKVSETFSPTSAVLILLRGFGIPNRCVVWAITGVVQVLMGLAKAREGRRAMAGQHSKGGDDGPGDSNMTDSTNMVWGGGGAGDVFTNSGGHGGTAGGGGDGSNGQSS